MKATLLLTTALCSLLSLSSCKSTQEVPKQNITETKMEQKEKDVLLKEGYTAGVITQTKEEGNCEWIIKLDSGLRYESLTMDDEFKKNNLNVFFKFVPQRRMSKCTNASPVQITDMILGK